MNEEIKRILNIKYPQVIKDTEMLYVIRQYILERKGIDVGEIQRPQGLPCVNFMSKAIQKGIHPMLAMEKNTDFHLMQFLFGICHVYYIKKYEQS